LNFNLRAFIEEHGLLTYITKPAGRANAPKQVIKSGESMTTATSVDVEEGGGIAIWREMWDDSVSRIYEKILGTLTTTSSHPNHHAEQPTYAYVMTALPEPKYGRPKKASKYFDVDGQKHSKYPFVMPVTVAASEATGAEAAELTSSPA
jgi:hypothetical protein